MQFSNQFDLPGFWESLDMFGINVNIRFCKQVSHKTKIGGLFSIIIYILLLIQIYLIYENLQDTSNPTVLFQQTFTQSAERFDITPSTFSLAFGLQDPNSIHFYDPSVYQITLQFKQSHKIFNPSTKDYTTLWNNRMVKLERCTQQHFKIEQAKHYFLSLSYQNLYCISLQESDIFIQGQFDAMTYAAIELIVNSCISGQKTPEGEDIICSGDDILNSKLNNGRLAVYYVDNAVVMRDKDNPFQPQGRESFWVSGPQFSKTLNINFRNTYLYSDVGLIATEIDTQRSLTFSSDREQTTPKSNNLLFDCYISFEKNTYSEYHRSYPKLDRALSQLGGIYNFLFAIGCLICKPVSLIEFNRKLINSLFSIEDEGQNSQNSGKDKEEEEENKKKNIFLTPIKKSVTQQQMTIPDFRDTITDQNQQFLTLNKNLFDSKPNINMKESIIQLNDLSKSKAVIDIPPSQKKNSISTLKNFARNTFRQLTLRQQQTEEISSQNQDLKEGKPSQISQSGSKKFNFSMSVIKERLKSIQIMKQKELRQKKDAKELESVFVSSFNSIRFKSWEYYASYFNVFSCWRSKKQNVIKEGVDKLYNHIDIFYIINKLIEVEKLKNLLLNENQLKLFEFIPQPILSTHSTQNNQDLNNPKISILYEDKRNMLEKTLDAQKAFNILCQTSHNMSQKDKRLIELLHPNFKHLFEDSVESETDLLEESLTLFSKNEVRQTISTHPCNKIEDISNNNRI